MFNQSLSVENQLKALIEILTSTEGSSRSHTALQDAFLVYERFPMECYSNGTIFK